METMTMLEMMVDGVGLVICLATITLVIRSRRQYRDSAEVPAPPPATDFSELLVAHRIEQEAENAFAAIVATVSTHRQQLMTAIEHAAPESISPATACQEDADPVNTPAAAEAHGRRDERDGGEWSSQAAPATLHLARKIRQRQQERHLH